MKNKRNEKTVRSWTGKLGALLCAVSLLCGACTKKPDADTSAISAVPVETPASGERFDQIPVVPYQMEESSFSYDGKDIYGEIYIPYNGKETHPAVILCHGMASHYFHLNHLAMILAERGVVTYTFDFCGGSTQPASSGSILDMSVVTEADDLRAVIDHVKEMDYVNPEEIYILGMSQGGYVATEIAAEKKDEIAGLILLFPAFNINDLVREMYPDASSVGETGTIFDETVGKRYFLDAMSVDIEADMRAYEGPVLILHGGKDEVVPVSYSMNARTCFPNSRLVVLKDGIHGFFEENESYQDWECMYFLLDHCPKDSICSENSSG